MFYNLAFWLLVFSYSAEKTPICKRGPFRSIHKCTPHVSTITDWNKCLAKRRNFTWAQATVLYEQHFARSTILIWAKQNRAIPTKWMPLKTMPLLFKAWQCLWRQNHCYECLLKLSKITGSKLSKIKRFGVVLSHETSAWVSQPLCKRGTPHCTSRGSWGKSAGPVPEASDRGLVPLKMLRAFWPIWGPGSFGSSEHFMYMRLLLLPPLWGRCCSSQIPRWGDYMPEEAWFFPLLCVFTKKETT